MTRSPIAKTAIITGAASGIGLATAHELHARGWKLGLVDVNAEALAKAATELDAHAALADVSDPKELKEAFDEFRLTLRRVDALFNNAGILRGGPFEEVPLGVHHTQMDIHMKGVVNGCHLAFPLMRERGGTIVNMSSSSAVTGIPRFSTYGASKSFITRVTEALSIEWERHGISVHAIEVPFVATPMIADEDHPIQSYVRSQGVDVKPEDVASKVVDIFEGRAGAGPIHALTRQLRQLKLAKRLLPQRAMRQMIKRISEQP